jgi:hypothetical protein
MKVVVTYHSREKRISLGGMLPPVDAHSYTYEIVQTMVSVKALISRTCTVAHCPGSSCIAAFELSML